MGELPVCACVYVRVGVCVSLCFWSEELLQWILTASGLLPCRNQRY